MTNTKNPNSELLRDARAELTEIIEKFDSGALPDENAAENLEITLDYVRVLLGLVDLSEEDDLAEDEIKIQYGNEVTDTGTRAECGCGLEIEAWRVGSTEEIRWFDRGGNASCRLAGQEQHAARADG